MGWRSGDIPARWPMRGGTSSTVQDDAATRHVGHAASVHCKGGRPHDLGDTCSARRPVVAVRNRHHRSGVQEQNAAQAVRQRSVRILRSGKKRWTPGHAIWVSDVFAWRGSPASWNEGLVQVTDASLHEHIDAQTAKKLHRLGDAPVVASLTLVGGAVIDVAALPEQRSALMGPFATQPSAERQQAVEHSPQ